MDWLKNLFTPGTVAGLLAFGAALSTILNYPALSAFLSDPETAKTMTVVFSGIMSLVAGALGGLGQKKP